MKRTEDIFQKIVALKRQGRKGALATVIECKGSTPAAPGAKMLVVEDGEMTGSVMGSVGGGCLEAAVYQMARKVIREGKSVLFPFTLLDDPLKKEGHMCGGVIRIFIVPI